MNRFNFWQRWLLTLSIVIIVFGLTAVFMSSMTSSGSLRQVDPIFWGRQSVPEPAIYFQRWVYGVLGATMAGWGIFIAFIAHYPFRNRETWAWNCLVMGIMIWYLPDTTLSLYFGVTFNAVVNTILLAATSLPLIFTRREFVR